MKKTFTILLVVILLLAVTGAAWASPPASKNFVATLSGAEEVPARDTQARGNAVIHVNEARLSYMLIVANIENVVAAHIHCAPEGVNGPVGVTLFSGGAPGSGRVDGVIASGTKPAPDAGNACGWVTVEDVAAAMRSGNAYVNVHTSDGDTTPNEGPGDFPGGEIRGQVREAGAS